MQAVHPRRGGLDVHKRSVVACVLLTQPDGTVQRRVSTFGTMTADLLALHDWLGGLGVTHIAMESTGVFVRRFTARAIPPAGRTGSEGYRWANDSPYGESQGGQEHVVEAGRAGRRVRPGPARPVYYGESCIACTPVPRDGTGHPSSTTPDATPAGQGRPVDAARSLPHAGRRAMSLHKGTNGCTVRKPYRGRSQGYTASR